VTGDARDEAATGQLAYGKSGMEQCREQPENEEGQMHGGWQSNAAGEVIGSIAGTR